MISFGLLIIEISELSCNLILLITSIYLTVGSYLRYIPVIVYAVLGGVTSIRHFAINLKKTKTYTHEIGFMLCLPRTILWAFVFIFTLVQYLKWYVWYDSDRPWSMVLVIVAAADYLIYCCHFVYRRIWYTHQWIHDNEPPVKVPRRTNTNKVYSFVIPRNNAPPPYSANGPNNSATAGGATFIGGDYGGDYSGGDSGGGGYCGGYGGGDSGGGGGGGDGGGGGGGGDGGGGC